MSKKDPLIRINSRGGTAPVTITSAGVYDGGRDNSLGGWVVGPNSISKGQLILSADGWIQLGQGSGTVRLDSTSTTYRLWAGGETAATAPLRMTATGSIYLAGTISAAAGDIGGFIIAADHIRDDANSFGLSSVVTAGDDVRFWAGATFANRATAPFRVTEGGVITATSGSVGGWTIGSDYLQNNDVLLHSNGYFRLGDPATPGDQAWLSASNATHRIWVGSDNPATAPFAVTKAGALTATGATITGAITATSGTLQTLDVTGTLTLKTAGLVKSDNYSGGVSGWRISYDGQAEFQDVLIRGDLHAVRFVEHIVSRVNGTIVVEADDYTYSLTQAVSYVGSDREMVIIDADGPTYPIGSGGEMITLRDGDQSITVYLDGSIPNGPRMYLTYSLVDIAFAAGALVQLETPTPPAGFLRMTADPVLYGPRYEVISGSGTGAKHVAVLGNLDQTYGMTAEVFGIGVGDYSTSNYLMWEPTSGFTLVGGAGDLSIDADGLTFQIGTSIANTAEVKWAAGATNYGYIGVNGGPSGGEAEMEIAVANGANFNRINLTAADGVRVFGSLTLTGNISMADDAWIGYPSGPLITFDNTDEQVEVTGGLLVTGDYKTYKNSTTYTGYIFVPLTVQATSTSWDGDAKDSDNNGTIDLSAAFGIPAGVRAIAASLLFTCPQAQKYCSLGPSTTYRTAIRQFSQVSNYLVSTSGIVPCDANGDVYFETTAVHGSEANVYITIWGYFI